eukprot:s1230_g22.t1
MFSKSQRRHSNHRLGPFGGNPGTTEMLFQGVEQGRGEEERPKDCLATRNRVSELAPSSVGRAGPSGPLVPVARHGAEADQQQAAASRAESDSGGGGTRAAKSLSMREESLTSCRNRQLRCSQGGGNKVDMDEGPSVNGNVSIVGHTTTDRPHMQQVWNARVALRTTSIQDIGGDDDSAGHDALVEVVEDTRDSWAEG